MAKIVNTKRLSKELEQSERTITTWRIQKKIPFIRMGYRTILFDVDKVKAAIEKFEVKAIA